MMSSDAINTSALSEFGDAGYQETIATCILTGEGKEKSLHI